uniref:RNA-dependent RNA polymerase n=1 Tax=Chromera velia CCMP2878 TaxID=1169474 RepID=A0A0G4H0D5_9ALVE|eukprot:Cvel_24111.t1-p1 / transcript=Cvel_24111.t1 / gene=Cvel_24111 / organism=Chromera_velia_CCMP2878 / gene_product=Probable RNA-dependent RNA polymerase SHL2, putative / transcript_product=Probable RNA-dependent RNA polymerase SHL2, putative / location=Cvel_scaffold2568:15695-19150(+) / protein_length=836 / sequence_SO=supercontig / SO=protein_coding / is_pseudo=false
MHRARYHHKTGTPLYFHGTRLSAGCVAAYVPSAVRDDLSLGRQEKNLLDGAKVFFEECRLNRRMVTILDIPRRCVEILIQGESVDEVFKVSVRFKRLAGPLRFLRNSQGENVPLIAARLREPPRVFSARAPVTSLAGRLAGQEAVRRLHTVLGGVMSDDDRFEWEEQSAAQSLTAELPRLLSEVSWERTVDFSPHQTLGSAFVLVLRVETEGTERALKEPAVWEDLEDFRLVERFWGHGGGSAHSQLQLGSQAGDAICSLPVWVGKEGDVAGEVNVCEVVGRRTERVDQWLGGQHRNVCWAIRALVDRGVISRWTLGEVVVEFLCGIAEETGEEAVVTILEALRECRPVECDPLIELRRYMRAEGLLPDDESEGEKEEEEEGHGRAPPAKKMKLSHEEKRGSGYDVQMEESSEETRNWGGEGGEEDESPPSHCMKVPRLLVTPLREMALPPETEVSNRVVRHFVSTEGFAPFDFLRVAFGDESGAPLFGGDARLSERVDRLLRDGVSVCGRTYRFLAFSSSQLREQSVWMVCCPSVASSLSAHRWNSPEKLREWMGNFSSIKTAAKYAARVGQCFSTTVPAAPVCEAAPLPRYPFRRLLSASTGPLGPSAAAAGVKKIEDVERDGYIFSDGTGSISKELLRRCLTTVPFHMEDVEEVSILQICMGGAKGTLVMNPSLPRPGESAHVEIRQSMLKFEAELSNLEVVAVGQVVPYYLNRNVIFVLTHRGVPAQAFINRQRRWIRALDSMLSSRSDAAAMIHTLGGVDTWTVRVLGALLRVPGGPSPSSDPFVRGCLLAARLHQLTQLRRKCRLFIREGAVLMGGMDETGKLPEGCVFF